MRVGLVLHQRSCDITTLQSAGSTSSALEPQESPATCRRTLYGAPLRHRCVGRVGVECTIKQATQRPPLCDAYGPFVDFDSERATRSVRRLLKGLGGGVWRVRCPGRPMGGRGRADCTRHMPRIDELINVRLIKCGPGRRRLRVIASGTITALPS